MMKKKCLFFKEKEFSFFKIASLPNWEGEKYSGGNRPSCFKYIRKVFEFLRDFQ